MKIKPLISALVGLAAFINAQGANDLFSDTAIPDPNFRSALLRHYPSLDINNNGTISAYEIREFRGTLDLSGKNISDLTGISNFKNITGLDCSNN